MQCRGSHRIKEKQNVFNFLEEQINSHLPTRPPALNLREKKVDVWRAQTPAPILLEAFEKRSTPVFLVEHFDPAARVND